MNYRASRLAGVPPSPLNGERAGVRGENVAMNPDCIAVSQSDRPHHTLALSPPAGNGEGMKAPTGHLSYRLISNSL